jgi:hypothetical protein
MGAVVICVFMLHLTIAQQMFVLEYLKKKMYAAHG